MKFLPSTSDIDTAQRGDPKVVGVDDDQMDDVLNALSSDTARTILTEIYSDAATPSELRDRTDISLQNISYHLTNLEDADLIQTAGTQYSEKGREMNIYAPPDDPIVVFVGTQERKNGLIDLLKRVFSAGFILVASTIWMFFETVRLAGPPGTPTGPGGVLTYPFITFFLGGLLILSIFVVWWIWARIRQ